ncbi:adenosylcobinamide-phosphate synthase CbiB [Thermus scotoductus]|uniref:Cobalamin biosynthesis protein CobD n=1 Tax=Thermus scotoductus TaxID=37636 RepID=A0A430S1N3_THESC|nr:adenosylcobinamide-phosphate synthase CbiB [Thermus scotoductus]RTG98025.1 cobalamin biosynthesis protein CobD [Thermus scotoductus]RTH27188.1 cobalamin biosynthesis protein CobD [Thermus scotoductus]RTH27553.1 cobalamin biosynthesis protein CobD [Thermus scotoductus]RTI35770.1 cobalamin biosynthesis protein CobD [Thermus scotoductus]
MSLLLALLLDFLFGEPPARFHPVVLMGRYLAWAWPQVRGFWTGAFYWTLGALLFALPALFLDLILRPLAWGWLLLGLFLKPLFSLRMLLWEVGRVEEALSYGPLQGPDSLAEARRRLARIVSRPTEDLSPEEVREAALESLGENLSDSVIAPLLYYALLGLAGAALYRYANTADAMWGYLEHGRRGAFAARADDLLNLVPARITGLLLCPPRLWPRLLQEARKTLSPNAGFPMAALALRLGVRLRKRGAYALNASAPSPTPKTTHQALRLALAVGYGAGFLLALLTLGR